MENHGVLLEAHPEGPPGDRGRTPVSGDDFEDLDAAFSSDVSWSTDDRSAYT